MFLPMTCTIENIEMQQNKKHIIGPTDHTQIHGSQPQPRSCVSTILVKLLSLWNSGATENTTQNCWTQLPQAIQVSCICNVIKWMLFDIEQQEHPKEKEQITRFWSLLWALSFASLSFSLCFNNCTRVHVRLRFGSESHHSQSERPGIGNETPSNSQKWIVGIGYHQHNIFLQ